MKLMTRAFSLLLAAAMAVSMTGLTAFAVEPPADGTPPASTAPGTGAESPGKRPHRADGGPEGPEEECSSLPGCDPAEGIHDPACPLYVAPTEPEPEPEPEAPVCAGLDGCDEASGVHVEGCPLYVAPTEPEPEPQPEPETPVCAGLDGCDEASGVMWRAAPSMLRLPSRSPSRSPNPRPPSALAWMAVTLETASTPRAAPFTPRPPVPEEPTEPTPPENTLLPEAVQAVVDLIDALPTAEELTSGWTGDREQVIADVQAAEAARAALDEDSLALLPSDKGDKLAALVALVGQISLMAPLPEAGPVTREVSDEASLKEAIEKANSGDTIQLTSDINVPSTSPQLIFAGNKTLTLDLNGWTLDLDRMYPLDVGSADGTGDLTIKDGSESGNGKLKESSISCRSKTAAPSPWKRHPCIGESQTGLSPKWRHF